MVSSGMSMLRALYVLEEQQDNKKLKEAIITLLMDPTNVEETTLDAETCETLADKILEAAIKDVEVLTLR